MRFKLVTRHPFSPSKVWFFVDKKRHPDVLSLKKDLIKKTPALRNVDAKSPEDFSLFIDDFELLDDSAIDIIRDGEIVSVAGRLGSGQNKKDATPFRKPNKQLSVNSSSSSDSEESSDRSSSSESSSSSSTSSSTSSSSLPTSHTRIARKTRPLITNKKAYVSSVPPGQGKQATHSRNERRRKKRLAERDEKLRRAAMELQPSSSSNAVPLGVHGNAELNNEFNFSMEPVNHEDSQPLSTLDIRASFDVLRNKNKRKGFKRLMSKAKPQKLTFPYNDHLGGNSSQTNSLPSNIIITSVDVEDETWNDIYDEVEVEVEEAALDINKSNESARGPISQLGWEALEAKWESAKPLTEITDIGVNSLIGWKQLDLHPLTMSPEIFLHAGLVKELDNENKTCLILPIPFQHPDLQIGSNDDMDLEDMSITFEDAIKAGWRVL